MALTVVQVKNAKPREKAYKLADERGLYLLVNPNGSKLWKLKYRFAGIEKKLSLGAFPEITLAAARDAREEAKKQLTNHIDPGILKNSIKRSQKEAAANSFEALAREWHAKFTPKWTKDHGERILIRLEQNIFPWIGKRPITEVTAPELKDWTQGSLAQELCLSPSQVNYALKRLVNSRLLAPVIKDESEIKLAPIIQSCQVFSIHGFKFVFPAELGSLTRGIPTAYAAPSLNNIIVTGDDPIPVWPTGNGTIVALH
jgi:Arm domain-containing DNA-binding protein/integrase-like protein